jgi:hypothetical protein
MSTPTVVGLRPWYPWPLSRWRWWTEPVRAERLAALRIGLAAVLLADVLTTYWPHAADFFGKGSLGRPGLSAPPWSQGRWTWSIFAGVEDPTVLRAGVAAWAAATAGLLVGFQTRLCALATWVLSMSFANLNPNIDNAGDTVRGIVLLYLVLCPCGAAWSGDAWRRRAGPALVFPWPLRLLFSQMVFIYFANGLHKAMGRDWRAGDSLYYVLGDLSLARWPYAGVPLPYSLTRVLTWLVLAWEVSFPLLVLWRPLRRAALSLGAAFHLGIGLCLELGGFPWYMLCLYLPLLPWERWTDRGKPKEGPAPKVVCDGGGRGQEAGLPCLHFPPPDP